MASATATSRRCSRPSSASRRSAAISDLLAYYASGNEEERLLAGGGILEFARLKILLSGVLQPGVEQATARAAGRFRAHLGDARSLPFEDASFDAVLLFGPLYHLGGRDDRLAALREAFRVGGMVAATAISRYAALLDQLKRGRIGDPAVFANVLEETSSGRRVPPDRRMGVFPDAYFHLPEELHDEIAEAGFNAIDVYAVQGLGWLSADFLDLWASETGRRHMLEIAERFEHDPHVQAVSPHLFAVGTRP